ncbi:unnamed protein product [Nezara viridula]|uniref:Uncharacterized protein n=1 Tax=Nezara viridula TaxID=85310 RepID=A0A9P0HL88_NEZVI|nr:unnamed protein product [Nezara viridula]
MFVILETIQNGHCLRGRGKSLSTVAVDTSSHKAVAVVNQPFPVSSGLLLYITAVPASSQVSSGSSSHVQAFAVDRFFGGHDGQEDSDERVGRS